MQRLFLIFPQVTPRVVATRAIRPLVLTSGLCFGPRMTTDEMVRNAITENDPLSACRATTEAIQHLSELREALSARRHLAIVDALREGASSGEVSRITKLTKSRVSQIHKSAQQPGALREARGMVEYFKAADASNDRPVTEFADDRPASAFVNDEPATPSVTYRDLLVANPESIAEREYESLDDVIDCLRAASLLGLASKVWNYSEDPMDAGPWRWRVLLYTQPLSEDAEDDWPYS